MNAKSVPYESILSPDQIKAVLTISESGSLGKAARLLGVSQPALTQQVKRLEQKYGRLLFVRHGGGVKPTFDGEAMIIFARAIASIGDELARHFRSSVPGLPLRVGFTEDFGRTRLPAVLGLFFREFPDFQVSTRCGDQTNLLRAFDQDELDLIITRHHDTPARGEVLWTEPTVWIGRADTRLPIGNPIPLVLAPESNLRKIMLDVLWKNGRTWKVPFESSSLATVEAAIGAGLGVAAFPVNMEWIQLVELDEAESGLPQLPDARFVVEKREPPRSKAAEVFSRLLETCARLSFGHEAMDALPAPETPDGDR